MKKNTRQLLGFVMGAGALFAQTLPNLANPPADAWLTYHSAYNGQRHSSLTQITPENVGNLKQIWRFDTGGKQAVKASPIIADGVLFLTTPDNIWALDAHTGTERWHYQHPRNNAFHIGHRGAAVYKDTVYLTTPDCHLIAFQAKDGKIKWDVVIADSNKGYWSTNAPLVVKNHVLVGVSGDFDNVPGQLKSIDADTGKTQWIFYSTPPAGVQDPDSGGATGGQMWTTGTYDPALNLVFVGTGNPTPVLNGTTRPGDNRWTCSIVALNPDTGKLQWGFQVSPHDTHDWDANEVPVLADADFEGRPRKLLMQASRNGYFFVIDRTNGKSLLTAPFAAVNWAKGIDSLGRPIPDPAKEPRRDGVLVAPNEAGATNFRPPSFDPKTGFLIVSAQDGYGIYFFKPEHGGYGWAGADYNVAGRSFLRAIDYRTGKIAWDHAIGDGGGTAGVLTTESGLTISGDNSTNVMALRTSDGVTLWNENIGKVQNAPITVELDGKQVLMVGGGSSLYAFALSAAQDPPASAKNAAVPTRVMLLDGESGGPYHKWALTSPLLKKQLEETGLFQVDIVTAPPAGGDYNAFHPDFSKYAVVVWNYDAPDERWPASLKASFEQYVRDGGGFVSVHAADNAFANWPAFNEMIGVGGWRGRAERSGPYWYYKDGKLVPDPAPGSAGSHGQRTPYQVAVRTSHPITEGLPQLWMHQGDELYARLRGPGKNVTVLATAYSDPANNGSGHDEPVLMTINYGKGRVFHTTMGHDINALSSVDFVVTFQRGTEWAATGKVTQKLPPNFPAANSVSYRTDFAAMDPGYKRGLNPLDAGAPLPTRGGMARTDQNSMVAHQQLLEKRKQGRINVYFEGDSITRRWGATDYPELLANWNQNFIGWNAADFGWGADGVENILWRIENGELDDVNPKVIVLLAGTNDVGRQAREADITAGIASVLRAMQGKAPGATIILTAIFPRNDRADAMQVIKRTNANLAKLADGKKIRYVDINRQLADADGKLLDGMMNPDKLHPTLKGYQVWADALKPILTELLGPPAREDHAPPPTGDPSAHQ